MATTYRTPVLMEPEEHRQLQRIAAALGVSVGELMRRAVRSAYLLPDQVQVRQAALQTLLELQVGDTDWAEAKGELLQERVALVGAEVIL